MKICTDCQFHKMRMCQAPQNVYLDPVTGQKHFKTRLCTDLRQGSASETNCGHEGSWWKPKTLMDKVSMFPPLVDILVPRNKQLFYGILLFISLLLWIKFF